MLATLVLSNAYSGLFYSVLTVPRTETPVDTAEQFIEYIDAHENINFKSISYISNLLKTIGPENELYYRIAQRFKK